MSGDKAVAWLREQVQVTLETAKACQSPSPWKAATHEADTWIVTDATGEPVIYDEGTPSLKEAAHIALNDPQDVIARCEAELAILGEHAPVHDYGGPYGPVCAVCGEPGQIGDEPAVVRYPCRTVRLTASGYKHRPGYGEHWGP